MKKLFLLLTYVFISMCISAQDLTQLYLVGNGTPAGWNNNNPGVMTLVEGTEATFTWTGPLTNGEFKFINTKGSWDSFTTTATTEAIDGQTYPLVWKDANDLKFLCTAPDVYTLTVDLVAMTLKFVKAVPITITDLWAVGTAVPNGKMKIEANLNQLPSQFKFIGELKVGTLKFMSTEKADATTQYIVPSTADIDIVGTTGSKTVTTATTAGWSVANADTTYKIEIDLLNKSVIAELFLPWTELYIVGAATRAGWDFSKGIPFKVDSLNPYIYTVDDTLMSGFGSGTESSRFKIVGQVTGEGPKSLHSTIMDEDILEATRLVPNSGDNKWAISSEKQGRYSIKVNLLRETIKAKYIDSTQINDTVQESVTRIDTKEYFTLSARNGYVNIVLKDGGNARAQLFDISGRVIAIAQNRKELSLGNSVRPGIYIVIVNTNKKQFVQKVFIK